MTNEYHPDQKTTSTSDVIVAWILAAAVIVAIGLLAPGTTVDLQPTTHALTAYIGL